MKYLLLCSFFFLNLSLVIGQIEIKSEYIGKSSYKSKGRQSSDVEGDAKVYSASVTLPLSIKKHADDRITLWAINGSFKFTDLNNRKLSKTTMPEEIMNTQASIIYMAPLSEKWSMSTVAGIGLYTCDRGYFDMNINNTMIHVAAMGIWHYKPTLDLGVGAAITTLLGYPMILPVFHVNWKSSAGKYAINTNFGAQSMGFSVTRKFSDTFKMSGIGNLSSITSLKRVEGHNMIFSHRYYVVGIEPEFKFGKIYMPITVGLSTYRPITYQRREFGSLFKIKNADKSHFTAAPYISVAFRYGR